jgi:molybdopterin converting factor small subunit
MTRVKLQFTGDVWARMGGGHMDFEFEGATLGALLEALFVRHNLRDLLLDENGKVRFRSRIAVNGRFSDTLQHMDTLVGDGDTIVLMRPGLGAR